jgi:polyferredoxin
MRKNNLPVGLIRYTTTNALAQHLTRGQIWRHVLRLRVLIYGAILGLICIGMLVSLGLRVPLKVDVIRDRGTFAREVADGQVENVYRLQIMNTSAKDGVYRMQADGLPGLSVASESEVAVPATSTQTVILRLRAPAASAPNGANRIALQLTSASDAGVRVREKTIFFGLRP